MHIYLYRTIVFINFVMKSKKICPKTPKIANFELFLGV